MIRHRRLHLLRPFQEIKRIHMVRNIPRPKRQRTRLIPLLRLFARDLAILHYRILPLPTRDDTDGFSGDLLRDGLGRTFGGTLEGGTEEDGVGDFDEAVVDAVGVDEGDAV